MSLTPVEERSYPYSNNFQSFYLQNYISKSVIFFVNL